jgi:hypothetical protein
MAGHLAKDYDKAPCSAFLLFAGQHRISPLHPPDLLPEALASSQPNSVRIVLPKIRKSLTVFHAEHDWRFPCS